MRTGIVFFYCKHRHSVFKSVLLYSGVILLHSGFNSFAFCSDISNFFNSLWSDSARFAWPAQVEKLKTTWKIIKMQYARLGSCRNNMVTMKWHSCKSQFSFFHHSERGLQIPVSPSMRRPSLQVPNASSIFNYILGFRHRNQNLCIPRLRNRFFRSKFSLPQLNHSEAFCGLDARPN